MSNRGRCLAMAGVVVLTAALLGACGDDDDDAGATPAPSADVSSTGSAAPTVDPKNKTQRDWVLVSLGKDDKTITLRWDHRSCGKTPQVDKSEVTGEVEILTTDYLVGEDCKAKPKAQWEKVDLTLDDPLGDRELVGCAPTDGAIDCRTGKVRRATKP